MKIFLKIIPSALVLLLLVSCDQTQSIKSDPFITEHLLFNQIGVYRHVEFLAKNIDLHTITFNDNYHAQILQQKTNNQLFGRSLRELGQENNSIVSVNGGFYNPKYQPVGLFIENGKTIVKQKKASLLSSCIGLDKTGKLFLETNFSRCKQAREAMQTGLMLINNGNINPAINTLQKKANILKLYFEPHKRTILAQSSDNKLIILITSPITLQDLAALLKNHPQAFGVKGISKALNLDGGSSTGIYVKFTKDSLYVPELKPVKTFLLFS